jgi:uncharacterized protein YbjT (DUF2867 family)
MSDRKIIVVFGATGAQGGGLIRAINADAGSQFQARAVTRNPSSDKAKALAALGAEVVAGDLSDHASIARAFKGAYGAYCVTFFWDHFSAERETAEARQMAEAAKAAGLKHVVWSTLEDVRTFVPLSDSRMPTLHGKYKVPHFDGKGEADAFFRDLGVPTTFFYASFYWDNFIYFGAGPKPGPDGQLQLVLPMGEGKLAGVAAEDIGKTAYGIFKRPDLIGRKVGVAGELLTGTEIAEKMSKAIKRPVRYQSVSFDTYRSFGFPGADDLGNMFQFYHDFEKQVNGLRDPAVARTLNPALQNFDQWLALNGAKIPLE